MPREPINSCFTLTLQKIDPRTAPGRIIHRGFTTEGPVATLIKNEILLSIQPAFGLTGATSEREGF